MTDYDSDNTDILLMIPPDYFSTLENNAGTRDGVQNSFSGEFPNSELVGDCLNISDLNTYSLPPYSTSSPLKSQNQPKPPELGDITTEGCIQEIDKFLNYSAPNNLSVQEFRPAHAFGSPSTKITANIEKPTSLLKLADLWSNPNENCSSLQEERLRRQHLEKSVQALHTKLLEYQQKMVVAVKVDDDKNQVIDKMAAEKAGFINTLAQYEQQIQHQQMQLQEQLKLASMVKDLQEKNHFLEQKMQSWTTSSCEIKEIHKTQIKDLETRLSNCKENEKQLTNSITELTKQLNEVQEHLDKAKSEKKSTQTKFVNEACLTKELQKQIVTLKQLSEKLNEKEGELLKKLESQKSSLKMHYQNQLEKAVARKVEQFQSQMEQMEATLLSEAKNREHLVAERAIKQIELINQKHEQEISLMHEKQNEEITLYRLQLSNSAKTIEELQKKLNVYQLQRSNIADQIHRIMETQWQKTIEVLTSSPTNQQKDETVNSYDWPKAGRVENENFQTPQSSRNSKVNDDTHKREVIEAYIELLLQKSPKDLDRLEEILNSQHNNAAKNRSKPPWK